MNPVLAALESIGHARAREVAHFTDEPNFPSYYHDVSPQAPYPPGAVYGLSIDPDPELSRLKSLAEFYERLCLYRPERAGEPEPWTPDSDQLDPARFDYRHPKGNPDEVRQARFRWLPARDWETGETVRVPAQAVIPGLDETEEIPLVSNLNPGGSALGPLGEGGAFRRGLFEMIERFSTLRADHDQSFIRRIEGWPPECDDLLAVLKRYRLEPFALDYGQAFGVPCVMTALLDRSGLATSTMTAHRASSNYADALTSGLFEALERRRPARLEHQLVFASLRPGDEIPRRRFQWTDLAQLTTFEERYRDVPVVSFEDLRRQETSVEEATESIQALGHSIYVADVTLPEVRDAGFEVTRVLIPELGKPCR